MQEGNSPWEIWGMEKTKGRETIQKCLGSGVLDEHPLCDNLPLLNSVASRYKQAWRAAWSL